MLGFKLQLKKSGCSCFFNLDFWESFWGCNDSFWAYKERLLESSKFRERYVGFNVDDH